MSKGWPTQPAKIWRSGYGIGWEAGCRAYTASRSRKPAPPGVTTLVAKVGTQMRITEIYKSIQGESSYSGLPCVFVRTTGCDLRCRWCDSEFTFTGGTAMTVDEIMG